MSDTRRNILVGLFVLFGLSALGILIVLFGKAPTWMMRGTTYPLQIQFDSVSGVREGTMVTMAGKSIGRVSEIEFVDSTHIDRGVRVVAAIYNEYRLPRGARAETSEAILGMGRPPIQIVVDAPTTEYHPLGQPISGRTATAVEAIFPNAVVSTMQKTATEIGEAAAALTPVLGDLHDLMEKRDMADVDKLGGHAGNLSTASARLDSLLKHFNDVLGDPQTQSQLKEGISNFHAISADGKVAAEKLKLFADDARLISTDVKGLVGKAGTTVDNVDRSVEHVSRALTENLDKLSLILDGLAIAASQIRNGEGTLGKFVRDDRLFESMVLTFKRLGEAGEEFKAVAKDWQKGKIRVAF